MLRLLQRLMALAGMLLVGSAAWSLAAYEAFESQARVAASDLRPTARVPTNPLLGRLEIPRLNLSVAILNNDDESSLSLAAGHVPGTSPIGSLGNAVIAGHRDTSFRSLRLIRTGDRIETLTNRKSIYLVDSIRVVDPSDTSLLDLNTSPSLTLVTCYPFDYVGPAPKRFVVQAKLVP